MAGEGIQLIQPTGGGGGEVARPVAAPNFVGMYNEAIKTALEPAKFQWDMYAKSQELGQNLEQLHDRARALDETIRSNKASEANKGLDLALRTREAAETERSHRATEGYQTGLLQLDNRKADETERHDKEDEDRAQREEDRLQRATEQQKLVEDSTIAKNNADTDTINQKLREEKDEYGKYQSDLDAIQKFKDAVKKFGPSDHYNISENPELQKLYDDTLGSLQTKEGHTMFQDFTGGQTALGEEITNQKTMSTWSPEAHSAFIESYTKAPDHMGNQEKFRNAFKTGSQIQANVTERSKMGYAGQTEYKRGIARGMPEEDAMALARSAEEQFKKEKPEAQEKPVEWKQADIDKALENLFPQDTAHNETDDAYAKRMQQYRSQAYANPNDFFKKFSAGQVITPGQTSAVAPTGEDYLKGKGITTPGSVYTESQAPAKPQVIVPKTPPAVVKKPGPEAKPSPTPGPKASNLPVNKTGMLGTTPNYIADVNQPPSSWTWLYNNLQGSEEEEEPTEAA